MKEGEKESPIRLNQIQKVLNYPELKQSCVCLALAELSIHEKEKNLGSDILF